MFKTLLSRKSHRQHAHALYGGVVTRARDAVFFKEHGVPDTFDGRFEMLVVHLFLLHERLKDEEKTARKVSQVVFDLFLDDMDSALREGGVGDQTVPKRLAKMTQVFYGRAGAFEEALLQADQLGSLQAVFRRNLFAEMEAQGNDELLAAYFVHQHEHLAQMTVDQIIASTQPFASFTRQEPENA